MPDAVGMAATAYAASSSLQNRCAYRGLQALLFLLGALGGLQTDTPADLHSRCICIFTLDLAVYAGKAQRAAG